MPQMQDTITANSVFTLVNLASYLINLDDLLKWSVCHLICWKPDTSSENSTTPWMPISSKMFKLDISAFKISRCLCESQYHFICVHNNNNHGQKTVLQKSWWRFRLLMSRSAEIMGGKNSREDKETLRGTNLKLQPLLKQAAQRKEKITD